MNTPEQLSIHEAKDVLATRAEPSVAQMLQTILERPDALQNVEVLERVVALYERQELRNAEKAFANAFAGLQSEIPNIVALRVVPDKHGNQKYVYAPFEAIMDQLKPKLHKHGFTVTFSSEIKDDRVTQTCTVQHIEGAKRVNHSTARIGSGPPGASPTQADGAASTYAKRFALGDAFNIIVDRDNDGRPADVRNEGDFITLDKADYLKEQVREVKFNEATFFKLAGCSNYEEITEGKYAVLINALEMKRRQA